MSSSSQVFIYNGAGASKESANDLKELFTNEDIFAKRPDVQLCDYHFNPRGLTTPTFVVPGGASSVIGRNVKPAMSQVSAIVGEFNYVGVCAGAFIGTGPADLYLTTHQPRGQKLEAPTYMFTTEDVKANLDFINDYHAIGSFYPNENHGNTSPKDYMPYRVQLSLTESNEKLAQLYVAGPGFEKVNSSNQSSVVATYADAPSYTFTGKKTKQIANLPAIVCSLPTETKGGVFLTGTHIEASVTNSQFLKFFKSAGAQNAALTREEIAAFDSEQTATKATVESLLSRALK